MQAITTVVQPLKENAIGGGLEGAERTTRETIRWSAPIISPDRQINAVKDEADARSRDSLQNSGYGTGAISTHRDSIVGTQFRLNAQPEFKLLGADETWAEEFQAVVEPMFNLLGDSEECWFDAAGQMTFTGIIRLLVGGFIFTGETLQSVEWLRDSGRPFNTAFLPIAPIRLSNPDCQPDTVNLRKGVASDFRGRPLGYWIQSAHPTDYFLDPTALSWRYIPARKPWGRKQIIHIYDPMQPEQSRGIADMVSVLKDMRMTKQFKEITLQNAVVNATYAAAVESELPKEMIFGAMGAGGQGMGSMLSDYMGALASYLTGTTNIAIDGVKMPHLFPGTKLNLKPMGTPGGVGTVFEESLNRHIAAGLGLSYEQFSKDYSKTNYSSARASMGETYKYMQGRKKQVADRNATIMYGLTMEEWINKKMLPLPRGFDINTFYNDPIKREALLACSWIGASRGQIDELKETQAAVLRINAGLSTYEMEAARLGEDYRRLFRQQAREMKMRTELKLPVGPVQATKPGNNDAKNTMNTSNANDDDDL